MIKATNGEKCHVGEDVAARSGVDVSRHDTMSVPRSAVDVGKQDRVAAGESFSTFGPTPATVASKRQSPGRDASRPSDMSGI